MSKSKWFVELLVNLAVAFAIAVIMESCNVCILTKDYTYLAARPLDIKILFLFPITGLFLTILQSREIAKSAKNAVSPTAKDADIIEVFGVTCIVGTISFTILLVVSWLAISNGVSPAEQIAGYFRSISELTLILFLLFRAMKALALEFCIRQKEKEFEEWFSKIDCEPETEAEAEVEKSEAEAEAEAEPEPEAETIYHFSPLKE